jgi:hypothetical protein
VDIFISLVAVAVELKIIIPEEEQVDMVEEEMLLELALEKMV